jgi:hypothetical protein
MQDDRKVSIPGSRLLVYFVVLITLIIEAAWRHYGLCGRPQQEGQPLSPSVDSL